MERLTKTHYISDNGHYMACSELNSCCDKECSTCNYLDEIVERLAAYEDTGLTPEEVSALIKDWSDLCTIVGECGGIDRLQELAEADKDGRVAVLPCKVGDTLYEVTGRKTISEYRVKAIRVELFCVFIEWEIEKGFVWQSLAGITQNELGKTVFLTREEAEKALEVMKNGN